MKKKVALRIFVIFHFVVWGALAFGLCALIPRRAEHETLESDFIWFRSIDSIWNVREICTNYFSCMAIIVLSLYTIGILFSYKEGKTGFAIHTVVFVASLFAWFSVLYDAVYIIPCVLLTASPLLSLVEFKLIKRIDMKLLNNE